MRVIHIAFECVPVYKTGGLADVVGSLPKALVKFGIEPIIVLPKYPWIKPVKFLPGTQIPINYIDSKYFQMGLKKHQPRLQARAYADFCLKTLYKLKEKRIQPQIIHVHDWHTALIPFLLKKQPDPFFAKTKTLLTIHNFAYQGNFPLRFFYQSEAEAILSYLGPHQKQISFLKLGIETADFINTVSLNHADEILSQKLSFGIRGRLRRKKKQFAGILNGIDYGTWNPRHDRLIKYQYDRHTVIKAKAKNKTHLQKELGLEKNSQIPLFGFIARLTAQKGLNLLIPFLDLIERRRIQVVILGSGQEKFEKILKQLSKQVDPHWYSVHVRYDEELAHKIYAGSDFFLIPSLYEPCGLTQMIAMAYGSIPIVTPVGGLKDTVIDSKTGIILSALTEEALKQAVEQATKLWEDPKVFSQIIDRVMQQDFSWDKSAREYARLYRRISQI